jgi:hypothetical protein
VGAAEGQERPSREVNTVVVPDASAPADAIRDPF